MALDINIRTINQLPLWKRDFEIVERKGLGHPDTICDSLMDSMSVALCDAYKREFGVILHHNLDKCLLTAGRSEPAFGGGKIIEPMKVFMGDRATMNVGEKTLDVRKIMEDNGRKWFQNNMRYVDSKEGVKFFSEVQPGSQNLSDIFKRKKTEYLGANDTSATVGYYPFTPTEDLVKRLESYLNSTLFHSLYPCSGEDVKIMAYRNAKGIDLTVAIALVDGFIKNEREYFSEKNSIQQEIFELASKRCTIPITGIHLNALDVAGRGTDGLYLTVSGTSAEAGDSGQVGRGNDVAGIIPLCRPMASEAAPGKNPVSHVGKIYNALSFKIAKRVFWETKGAEEVYCWLLSRIGKPINEPAAVSVQTISEGELKPYWSPIIEEIVEEEFENLDKFCKELAKGKIKLY